MCSLSHATGVSVAEDIDKAREPLPLAAVYFITPSPASVSRLLGDFATKPLYPSVHIYFSNRVSGEMVERIKRNRASAACLWRQTVHVDGQLRLSHLHWHVAVCSFAGHDCRRALQV